MSTVQFATHRRIHVGLPTRNLAESVQFYSTLFGQQPTKTRTGYAKFEIAEPPVNLSLNETTGAVGPISPVSHFGIQVKSSEAVAETAQRLKDAGLETRIEKNVTCCYAEQDKVWVRDPDGNPWEVFVVLADTPVQRQSADCCPTDCCTERAVACQCA
jgi:catechol 2,3-dioxygenase-like lactoylglutathione lyase family enzyme